MNCKCLMPRTCVLAYIFLVCTAASVEDRKDLEDSRQMIFSKGPLRETYFKKTDGRRSDHVYIGRIPDIIFRNGRSYEEKQANGEREQVVRTGVKRRWERAIRFKSRRRLGVYNTGTARRRSRICRRRRCRG